MVAPRCSAAGKGQSSHMSVTYRGVDVAEKPVRAAGMLTAHQQQVAAGWPSAARGRHRHNATTIIRRTPHTLQANPYRRRATRDTWPKNGPPSRFTPIFTSTRISPEDT
jgi:hypothetical protein